MSQENLQPLKLSDKELAIYKGLREIGEEIASFFLDGVRLMDDGNYLTRANILGHLAREIDSGLRDFLSRKSDKKKKGKRDKI